MEIVTAVCLIILAFVVGHFSGEISGAIFGYNSRGREEQNLKNEITLLETELEEQKNRLQEQENRILDMEDKILSGEDDDDLFELGEEDDDY